MNRIYFLLIFTAITFSTKAQQYQLDSMVHTVNGKQFITVQKHDIDKKQAEIIRFDKNDTSPEKRYTERISVLNDEHYNTLQTVFELWDTDNNSWVGYEKTEQEYNSDNKLIGQTSFRKYGKEWRMGYQHKKTYAKDSLVETDYEFRHNKFQLTIKSITFINAHNKVDYY